MKNLLYTLSLLFIISSCKQKENHPPKELPNIILLVGDDQGYPYFGFMGADYVHTPNMDILANDDLFTVTDVFDRDGVALVIWLFRFLLLRHQ